MSSKSATLRAFRAGSKSVGMATTSIILDERWALKPMPLEVGISVIF
jgi:hypothetical protein